jgi:hypothetical protein
LRKPHSKDICDRLLIAPSSYGNAVKDASGASGSRAATSSNPLGLAGGRVTGQSQLKGTKSQGSKQGTRNDPLGLNR